MRLQTPDDLHGALDRDLSWRKREITTARFALADLREHVKPIWLRASVCLLYAHWEGFVKFGASAYLNFVSLRRLRLRELPPSLVALCLRGELRNRDATERLSVHASLVQVLMGGMHERRELPWAEALRGVANLNSDQLREITVLLGLQSIRYETKKAFLDERLLANRNRIAHGERVDIAPAEYDEMHASVLELIGWFRDDLVEAVDRRAYVKS
ncbi:MAG: hypothetical protein HYZ53_22215 [Planctomycetes bacterium]|nr:hypothetical protein [Planctomycetota bacterium]